jgi:hypothetical protein
MGTAQLRIVGAGLLFILIFLSGIWLSNSGKPLNVIILTIHKLISLAAVVFLVMTIYQINQVAKLSAIELIASVVTGLLFLSNIISGGLLSTGKSMPAAILAMHQITPFLTVFSTAVTLYLLLSRK